MQFVYPSGEVLKGNVDHNVWFEKLGLNQINFKEFDVNDQIE